MTIIRCAWADHSDIEREYHDREWGVPCRDDQSLFELFVLEGAQAGLAWRTVLAKRDHYRQVYHGYDIARIAAMSDHDLDALAHDTGIIRNRLKIASARTNARAALSIIAEHGSFSGYLWSFVDGDTITNAWTQASHVPGQSAQSDAMSLALRKRGFRFAGSTICYALMQASGMVNDHVVDCHRYA
ncbi:DNA-3-methyladenine glycosylase I [Luteibacter sp. Sphag1AF]|uniref:DNA-3-methyladenine glycosylase I n=1 Tax=Luteibacter sp. Sphag1AF TaxID=2587031 RepID=UPI0016135437|nr:DNA-3-methyladenine glycosylase I [Luteibacter sp. Sphag1AF]MBB3228008.1 DNA-3-methyladenine glycosylase I [Luteibacter sp. Sphag1AF]